MLKNKQLSSLDGRVAVALCTKTGRGNFVNHMAQIEMRSIVHY